MRLNITKSFNLSGITRRCSELPEYTLGFDRSVSISVCIIQIPQTANIYVNGQINRQCLMNIDSITQLICYSYQS